MHASRAVDGWTGEDRETACYAHGVKDHTKLRVYDQSVDVAKRVYVATRGFPESERFGLQSQLRRAAVSVVANIVEGCARSPFFNPEKDAPPKICVQFMSIAYGSASELHCLLDLAASDELALLTRGDPYVAALIEQCTALVRSLSRLLKNTEDR